MEPPILIFVISLFGLIMFVIYFIYKKIVNYINERKYLKLKEEKTRKEREEADRRQKEEDEAIRQKEEEARREREAAAKRQKKEEARRKREAIAKKQKEEETRKEREEADRRQKEEDEAKRQKEEEARREREAAAKRQKEEEARREREAIVKKQKEEEQNEISKKLNFLSSNTKILLSSSNNKVFFRKIPNNERSYYLFDYISNYNLDDFSNLYKDIRNNLIFRFKDGNNLKLKGTNDNLISYLLALSLFNLDQSIFNNKDYVLTIIPSSTRDKSELRFKKIVSEICYILHIEDGYHVFERFQDRIDSRQSGKNAIDVLYGIRISKDLTNRKIILLDDIITKGTSMREFNNMLSNKGVTSITNVFIGKTYYSNHYFNKDEMDIYNSNNYNFIKINT